MSECYCSEDFGPCEDHGEILVQREGASLRSAHQLVELFIDDAQSLGAVLSRTAQIDISGLVWDGAWLANSDDFDTLVHYKDQIESDLYTLDNINCCWVQWEDGYVIANVTGGPLKDL